MLTDVRQFKEYKAGNGCGGGHFDITKWSRAERKKANYDGVDPLADFSDKDLKEGNLQIRLR